jgi:hypothetical protein
MNIKNFGSKLCVLRGLRGEIQVIVNKRTPLTIKKNMEAECGGTSGYTCGNSSSG